MRRVEQAGERHVEVHNDELFAQQARRARLVQQTVLAVGVGVLSDHLQGVIAGVVDVDRVACRVGHVDLVGLLVAPDAVATFEGRVVNDLDVALDAAVGLEGDLEELAVAEEADVELSLIHI